MRINITFSRGRSRHDLSATQCELHYQIQKNLPQQQWCVCWSDMFPVNWSRRNVVFNCHHYFSFSVTQNLLLSQIAPMKSEHSKLRLRNLIGNRRRRANTRNCSFGANLTVINSFDAKFKCFPPVEVGSLSKHDDDDDNKNVANFCIFDKQKL